MGRNKQQYDDNDELILLAVVEWDIPKDTTTSTSIWNEDNGDEDDDGAPTSTMTTKVRVYQSDIVRLQNDTVPSKAVLNGNGLQTILNHELETHIFGGETTTALAEHHDENVFDEDDSTKRITTTIMEVYDAAQSSYISLSQPDLQTESIVTRLGARLRVHVQVMPKTTTTTNNSTGTGTAAAADCTTRHSPKAIMGRFFPYDASIGVDIGGARLCVQETSNQQNAGTGINVWDGALLLAHYLKTQPTLVQNQRVLELGAGCGLVGLAAGVLGAHQVLLTDLPYALPNLQTNVERHADLWTRSGCQQMQCHALDWYHPPSFQELGAILVSTPTNEEEEDDDSRAHAWKPNVILVADCVWMQELVEPLLKTIQQLTQQTTNIDVGNGTTTNNDSATKVLISYQRRGKSTHQEFWTGIHTRFDGAVVQEIDTSSVGIDKPESLYLLSMDL